jgi:hypothetical protein
MKCQSPAATQNPATTSRLALGNIEIKPKFFHVFKVSFNGEIHILLGGSIETGEWAQMQTRIGELLGSPSDMSQVTYSFVDDDVDDITMFIHSPTGFIHTYIYCRFSAECWKSFLNLMRSDISKVRTLRVQCSPQV